MKNCCRKRFPHSASRFPNWLFTEKRLLSHDQEINQSDSNRGQKIWNIEMKDRNPNFCQQFLSKSSTTKKTPKNSGKRNFPVLRVSCSRFFSTQKRSTSLFCVDQSSCSVALLLLLPVSLMVAKTGRGDNRLRGGSSIRNYFNVIVFKLTLKPTRFSPGSPGMNRERSNCWHCFRFHICVRLPLPAPSGQSSLPSNETSEVGTGASRAVHSKCVVYIFHSSLYRAVSLSMTVFSLSALLSGRHIWNCRIYDGWGGKPGEWHCLSQTMPDHSGFGKRVHLKRNGPEEG